MPPRNKEKSLGYALLVAMLATWPGLFSVYFVTPFWSKVLFAGIAVCGAICSVVILVALVRESFHQESPPATEPDGPTLHRIVTAFRVGGVALLIAAGICLYLVSRHHDMIVYAIMTATSGVSVLAYSEWLRHLAKRRE